jgi:hypothetical protein
VPADPAQRPQRVGPAHPVGRDAAVRLEVDQRTARARSEDPVDATAVEAEAAERGLELGDVIAAQVR